MNLSFAPHLEVRPFEGRGLIAFGERGTDVYPGPVYAALASLIDGSLTEAEVLAACGSEDREATVSALAELKRAGVLLAHQNGAAADGTAAWWSSQRVSPDTAEERIRTASVSVQSFGAIDIRPTVAALTESALAVREDGRLSLVLVDDYLHGDLADFNHGALRENRTWMLAQPLGTQLLVGPVISPERGPCWECLANRLREKRSLRQRLGLSHGSAQLGGLPAQSELGPALVATEIMRWIAGARPELDSTILSFDSRTWQLSSHTLVWRPQCPACGEAEASLSQHAPPIRLRRSGSARSGGALRTVAPEVTLERFQHHVSPLTGIVDALVRLPGPEHLHVYGADRGIARVHGDRRGWEFMTGMSASGKGTSDERARASALCEALERHSGAFCGDEPRRRATAAEIGDKAVLPNEYMCFSERQFEDRERLNSISPLRFRVPQPFEPEAAIDWSPVWSLTHQDERWVPTALCYYGADVPGQRYCVAESNGNAGGNTVEEAILHGLLELVERDHVALWWYNQTPAPGVDLDSIDDPWLAWLRGHLAEQEQRLWAVDLTADLGIAVAACLVVGADGQRIGMGFGAQLDLGSAVIRAATELVQLGLGGTSGGLGAKGQLALADHAFAQPDRAVPARSCIEEFSGDVVDALQRCHEAIERQGLELLVLDQTRPDIGLPVVKAIVPGLRHFWPRFGPGRLYDVPVELGRVARRLQEHELNPTPPTS